MIEGLTEEVANAAPVGVRGRIDCSSIRRSGRQSLELRGLEQFPGYPQMEEVTANEPKASVTMHSITAVCKLENGDAKRNMRKRTNATYHKITQLLIKPPCVFPICAFQPIGSVGLDVRVVRNELLSCLCRE